MPHPLKIYPAPGSLFGPCHVPCDHIECRRLRLEASQECDVCGLPVGFNHPYFERDGSQIHQACLDGIYA